MGAGADSQTARPGSPGNPDSERALEPPSLLSSLVLGAVLAAGVSGGGELLGLGRAGLGALLELRGASGAAEGTGLVASDAINGVRLAMQLAHEEASSAFTATGELSESAIQGAQEIIPTGQLGNPAIPQGFSEVRDSNVQRPFGSVPGPLLHGCGHPRGVLWSRFQGNLHRGGRTDLLPALRRGCTMKVRCIKLLDSRGTPASHSAWAKLGGVYQVLALWIEPERTRLRLIGEEPTPALFEPSMFEVASSVIPPNWVAVSPEPGYLSLAPLSWSVSGFWERFFDGDPDAVANFNAERIRIIEADP